MGRKKKKKLNQKRYLIQDSEIETEDKMIEQEIKDPIEGTFSQYLWFLFKVLFFDSTKPGFIYKIYLKIKRIFRNRDSAP